MSNLERSWEILIFKIQRLGGAGVAHLVEHLTDLILAQVMFSGSLGSSPHQAPC